MLPSALLQIYVAACITSIPISDVRLRCNPRRQADCLFAKSNSRTSGHLPAQIFFNEPAARSIHYSLVVKLSWEGFSGRESKSSAPQVFSYCVAPGRSIVPLPANIHFAPEETKNLWQSIPEAIWSYVLPSCNLKGKRYKQIE